MRISLLEKREDFYEILDKTLKNTGYRFGESSNNINFFSNKYLNFIATKSLPINVFEVLRKEYSISISIKFRIFQKLYVYLAINKYFRAFFSHKIILLPKYLNNFLILGGNHRIRLFPKNISYSLLILKQNERISYIENDIKIRSEYNLKYAPKIIDSGKKWIKEEYLIGTPLNRLLIKEEKNEIIEKVINLHWENLIIPSMQKVLLKDFLTNAYNKITCTLKLNEYYRKIDILDKIEKIFKALADLIKSETISLSYTHGDFQEANILVNNSSFKVIDWEHSDKRFYLYDFFILKSMQRENNDLIKSFEKFKLNFSRKLLMISLKKEDLIILIIEELIFKVHESFSKNYFKNGKGINILCNQIEKYINDQRNNLN